MDRIVNGECCDHVRFYQNEIVFVKSKNDVNQCVYCLSERRINHKFKLICEFRNSSESVHKILTYFEEQIISFKFYDSNNIMFIKEEIPEYIKSFLDTNEHPLIIKNREILCLGSLDNDFFEKIYQIINNICEDCGTKKKYGLDKCIRCLFNLNKTIINN